MQNSKTNLVKLLSNPSALFDAIPRRFDDNISFRKELYCLLAEDRGACSAMLAASFVDPRIFFNALLWCPATEMGARARNMPFVLYRPKQEEAVLAIKDAIDGGGDLVVDKSRKEGATFLLVGMGMLYWLVMPQFNCLWGSRDESLVDTSSSIVNGVVLGNEKSIFYKLMYLLNTLPSTLQPKYLKNHLLLQNLDNGSMHSGSTTNLGFGKGSRAPVIVVDEFAAIEPQLATAILENIADVGATCIINSTQGPWAGAHAYDKVLANPSVHKVRLGWEYNPNKTVGLYQSPAEGKVIIYDVDYYRNNYLGRFDHVVAGQTYDVGAFEGTYPFVADGGESVLGSKRSLYIDKERQRPGRTLQGFAQNILGIAYGSTDSFFRHQLLASLADRTRAPTWEGTIAYQLVDSGVEAHFEPGGQNSHLSWWGNLRDGRPNQSHSYVIGCDISRGTGTSNSVAAVIDCHARELVGLLVTPYCRIEHFAELCVGLSLWVGGALPVILNWEVNGASEFGARVEELEYPYVWFRETGGKRRDAGWRSTAGPNGTKVSVLNALDAALNEGLKEKAQFDRLVIYSKDLIKEMSQYVWQSGKIDAGPVSAATDSSGAKAAHGDRVIAVALALLAAKEQAIPEASVVMRPERGSFMELLEEQRQQDRMEARERRIWLF